MGGGVRAARRIQITYIYIYIYVRDAATIASEREWPIVEKEPRHNRINEIICIKCILNEQQ